MVLKVDNTYRLKMRTGEISFLVHTKVESFMLNELHLSFESIQDIFLYMYSFIVEKGI